MKNSKMLKAVIVVLMVMFLILKPAINITAQDAYTNLEKYWKYRERLKNFVVVGDCMGCSLPCTGRGNNDVLDYSDVTIELGYYIGILAMEYKLLNDHQSTANNAQLENTKRELFYALEAINRLDIEAEFTWDSYASYSYNTWIMDVGNLNGFFIRCDVVEGDQSLQVPSFLNWNYFDNQTNFTSSDTYNADLLTSSFAPPEDGWKTKYVDEQNSVVGSYSSAYQNGYHSETETQDQLLHMLAGLALVVKCVPSNATWNNNSFLWDTQYSGTTSLVSEAKKIVARMCEPILNNTGNIDWSDVADLFGILPFSDDNNLILNPVVDCSNCESFWSGGRINCAQGLHNNEGLCTVKTDCFRNGSNMSLLSYGLNWTYSQIMNDLPQFYVPHSNITWDAYAILNASGIWGVIHNTIAPSWNEGTFDEFISILAVIGNVWGIEYNIINYDAMDYSHIEDLGMLYQVLYGGPNLISTDFYEDMLDESHCFGRDGHPGIYDWGGASARRWYPSSAQNGCAAYEYNGLDYMWLFNLYAIANYEDYFEDNDYSYTYIPPQQLCPTDIIKTNYDEYETKNFLASNSIIAGNYGSSNDGPFNNPCDGSGTYRHPNNYNVKCATTNIQNDQADGINKIWDWDQYPLHSGNVNFVAGSHVDLLPGFNAEYGSTFNATTDNTLSPFTNCSSGDVYRKTKTTKNVKNKKSIDNAYLFPNPNDGNFSLMYHLTNSEGELLISDFTGRTVYKQNITGSDGQVSINASSLSAGIYYWNLVSDKLNIGKGKIVIIKNN